MDNCGPAERSGLQSTHGSCCVEIFRMDDRECGVAAMNRDLLAYLARYLDIPAELEQALSASSLVQEFPKGAMLLREGEPVAKSYFILKGCMRSYVLKEGDDRTIGFFIEEEPMIPVGYGTDAPSMHFLECMEDTVAVVASPDQEARMLAEHPELKAVCLELTEVMAAKLQESLARYKTSSPEERYLELIGRRPDLLQRIPQYHIASYLGVQPESLSRIRKRLSRPSGD